MEVMNNRNISMNVNTAPPAQANNRETAREPVTVVASAQISAAAHLPSSSVIMTEESIRSELVQLQETISIEFFDKFVQEANARLMPTNKGFAYDFHEPTNRIIVRVIDRDTDEVIREIPPEKILNATEKMLELVGVIFDKSV